MEWLLLLAGLVTGGQAAWFLGKAQARDSLGIVKEQIAQKDEEIIRLRELYGTERVEHAGLKARFGETEKHLAAQKRFLEESQKTLSRWCRAHRALHERVARTSGPPAEARWQRDEQTWYPGGVWTVQMTDKGSECVQFRCYPSCDSLY